MTPPMRKAQAVRRATWAGAGALLGAAAIARRHPVAGAGVLAAAATLRRRRVPPAQPGAGPHAVARPVRPAAGGARRSTTAPGPRRPTCSTPSRARACAGPSSCSAARPSGTPRPVRRIAAEGHQIANHGYDHGILIFRGTAHVRDQLARCEAAVAAAAGRGRDEPAVPRAARLPRARDRPRRAPGRLPGGGMDARGVRLGRAGRRRDRPPGHPRARAGHDPAAPRRRRVGARSGPASRRPTRSPTSAGRPGRATWRW